MNMLLLFQFAKQSVAAPKLIKLGLDAKMKAKKQLPVRPTIDMSNFK